VEAHLDARREKRLSHDAQRGRHNHRRRDAR
jgi:hypothetical protein